MVEVTAMHGVARKVDFCTFCSTDCKDGRATCKSRQTSTHVSCGEEAPGNENSEVKVKRTFCVTIKFIT